MTTNQPTQPDMFEPPEKFGNYLADKSLAAFNQPTDATRFKAALYAQYPEPVADDIWQRFDSLTAQLAAKQAEAKAWEAWGLSQHNALQDALYLITLSQTAWDYEADELLQNTEEDCNVPKPQPVDASSLARIARVALEAHKYVQATQLGNNYEEEERFEELHSSVDALTPNDIALAQSLVGGA